MEVVKRPLLLLAGLAAAQPGGAQCRLCDEPQPMRAAQPPSRELDLRIETSLNFDRLILYGSGRGGATIRPTGANGSEGAVLELGPRASVGTLLVHGQPNRELSVDMPHRIELYSGAGGRISLVDITTDLPPVPRLDPAGNLSFHFGGRLLVTGNDEGQFRGDLAISVEYATDPSILAESLTAR